MLHLCRAESEREALATAYWWWPNSALGGSLSTELRAPADFETATALVRPDDIEGTMPLGPDPERHLQEVSKFVEAGFDHVYLYQVGPDQGGFIDFCRRELLPHLDAEPARLVTRSD